MIRRETQKKARHLPLRELLSRAPNVLTRVVPCWVASPLSVSQLLDATAERFDLVIFDEASQVLPEEAVPAIYRGKQLVVAGDSHPRPGYRVTTYTPTSTYCPPVVWRHATASVFFPWRSASVGTRTQV